MRLSVRNNGCMVGGGAQYHSGSDGADDGQGTLCSSWSSSHCGTCQRAEAKLSHQEAAKSPRKAALLGGMGRGKSSVLLVLGVRD